MNKIQLGIVVVYLVAENDEKLLDIHLQQITSCTTVSYKIYAAANRLIPKFLNKIKQHPNVVLCKIPTTDLIAGAEASFYRDHLIKRAIKDGVSHIALLHVDSFPVKKGWAKELTDQLTLKEPLVAIVREENKDFKPNTSFLMFTKGFYLTYKPNLLLTDSELSSQSYRQYSEKFPHNPDPGVGYGLTIFKNHLDWIQLKRSNVIEHHPVFGGVYGDLVFHLGAAAQKIKILYKDIVQVRGRDTNVPIIKFLKKLLLIFFKERSSCASKLFS